MSEITVERKAELGRYMMETGASEWFRYDELGTFGFEWDEDDKGATFSDPDEEAERYITYVEFFDAHYAGVFHRGYAGKVAGWVTDWVQFVDDYDADTTDATLQILLYGELIYS